MVVAESVVKSCDSNLLKRNGGHISLSKYWAKAKVSMSDFEAYKAQFVFDIQTIVEMGNSKGASNQLGSYRNIKTISL